MSSSRIGFTGAIHPVTIYVLTLVFTSLMALSCAGEDNRDLEIGAAALTDACYSGCIARGGDEAICAEACASIGGDNCFRGCLDRGGDKNRCTEACDAARGGNCFQGCLERGGDEATCKDACRRRSDGRDACIDGEEAERDGITYVCTDGKWKPVATIQ